MLVFMERNRKNKLVPVLFAIAALLPGQIYASGDVSPIFFLPPIFLTILLFPLSLYLSYKLFKSAFRLEFRVGYLLAIAFNAFLNALLIIFLYAVYSGGPSGSGKLFAISLLISVVLAVAFFLQQKPKFVFLPLIALFFTLSHVVLLVGATLASIAVVLNIK